MNSRLPTSNVIWLFVNIRVLILIFLIVLRFFQSRDYTFFKNNNHNSNWVWLVELSTNKCLINLGGWGGGLQTSSKVFRGWSKSGRCKSGSWYKRKNLQILNLQIFAALLIHLLTTTTDFDKLFFKFFLCSHSWCL